MECYPDLGWKFIFKAFTGVTWLAYANEKTSALSGDKKEKRLVKRNALNTENWWWNATEDVWNLGQKQRWFQHAGLTTVKSYYARSVLGQIIQQNDVGGKRTSNVAADMCDLILFIYECVLKMPTINACFSFIFCRCHCCWFCSSTSAFSRSPGSVNGYLGTASDRYERQRWNWFQQVCHL